MSLKLNIYYFLKRCIYLFLIGKADQINEEKERWRENSSFYWFTTQVAAMAGTESLWIQEPGAS